MKRIYNYPVLIDVEEGTYVASCPSFPGCVAQAKTYEEAVDEITEGIEVFIDTYQKRHWSLPVETVPALTIVKVAVNG
ncbi:MAG: type II toxin-antitoxin system HicB family antitoxin [Deltaproteobacteria bacterium]|nr:type II toxin-antitoxin system HicB family antitoxin [Deltaproteobacteria bacterium]MBI4224257.1 type II toxin-antitoxin system HicB family antitoxin [Deltaproteobacteria bacterium]